jgi:Holliday junction resolvase RusA-like endonuclease
MVPEARAWKDGATLMVKAAGQSLPDGRLVMSLQLFPPKGFRGDTSNCVKLVEDAVFAAFGETDHRVCELHVYRNERGLSQRIVVLVEDVRSHYAPS